jgi:hypothetical protein
MFDTPVLFLIFNRPDHAQKVFNEIKKQQPKKLFVHADGPRNLERSDYQKCLESRKIIEQQVDWDCDLHLLFREETLGCGIGPASAISWFFEHVKEGIIIEEDCLPHPDFFGYCSELLDRYRSDERIMVIGATTYRDDYPCDNSYAFTLYGTMAAWATWKRVWDMYDYTLSRFTRDQLKDKLKKHFYSRFEYKNWLGLYDWIVKDEFHSYWDWQLHFTIFYNSGIAIRPGQNMISNIGTGPDATHTAYSVNESFRANRPVFATLPLDHPPAVIIDKKRDSRFYKNMYMIPLHKRILKPVFQLIYTGRTGNNSFFMKVLDKYRSIKKLL